MRLLWDLRLFSYGYAHRGVGSYVNAVAGACAFTNTKITIVAWGNRGDVPDAIAKKVDIWIHYRKGSWKSSIVLVPLLTILYRVDLVHYWIALGPLWNVGMSPFVVCRTMVTVFDTGVDEWDLPHAKAVRRTTYWKVQKKAFAGAHGIMAISRFTGERLQNLYRVPENRIRVVYPPLISATDGNAGVKARKRYLITLGGDLHKNTRKVITAFVKIRSMLPEVRLVIIGEFEQKLYGDALPEGIEHEAGIGRYAHHLDECSGLVYCSRYEGLGLPPIEAMNYGCPILASAIPPLLEICNGAACFADPDVQKSIEDGMLNLLGHTRYWQEKSLEGAARYRQMAANTGEKYQKLIQMIMTDEKGACLW